MDLNCRAISITTHRRLCDDCSSFRKIRKLFFVSRPTVTSKKARATSRMNSIPEWEFRECLFRLIKEEPASPGELFEKRCDWVCSCPLSTLQPRLAEARASKQRSARQTSHKFPGAFTLAASLFIRFLRTPKNEPTLRPM